LPELIVEHLSICIGFLDIVRKTDRQTNRQTAVKTQPRDCVGVGNK